MTTVVQCHDCHRPLRNPPIRDHRGRPYGPKCAQDRGYTSSTQRKAKAAQPARAGDPAQPPLWDDNKEGIDMQRDNKQPKPAGCRCPVGWPITAWRESRGVSSPVREHHRNLCGLPDETVEPVS